MKTPTLPAEAAADRIVLIPDADRSRSRPLIALLALTLVAAMLLGGGVVYTWQQGRLRDRDQIVQAARVEAATAQARAGTTLAEQTALQAHVAELEAVVGALQKEQNIIRGQATQAEGRVERTQARLDDAQARLDDAQARLDEVQARLGAMTGPPVANGRHIAYILAAGAAQSPPRMVIDLGRWFTGDAARRAAIRDGALTTGEHLFQRRYLRNTDRLLWILPVRPGALFTIGRHDGAARQTDVTFARLASILASPSNGRIAHDPFWIDVRGQKVTSGLQQIYRAP